MQSQSDRLKVFTTTALEAIGIGQCNATLLRWERRGEFPRRFYLSPKCPVWRATEIEAWLAERQATAEPNRSTQKATATRTRRRLAETVTPR